MSKAAFQEAVYNAIGETVTGYYNDKPFLAKVTETRVKLGGVISVTMVSEENETLLLTSEYLRLGYGGNCGSFTNLHISFNY